MSMWSLRKVALAVAVVLLSSIPAVCFAQSMSKREVRQQYRRARKAMKIKNYEKASKLFWDVIENGEGYPNYQRFARFRMANALLQQKLPLVSLNISTARVLKKLNVRQTKYDVNVKPAPDRAFLSALTILLKTAESIGDESLVTRQLRGNPLFTQLPTNQALLLQMLEDPVRHWLPIPARFVKKNKTRFINEWKKSRQILRDNLFYFVGRLFYLKRYRSLKEGKALAAIKTSLRAAKDRRWRRVPTRTFQFAHLLLSKVSKTAVNNYYPKSLFIRGTMYHRVGLLRNKTALHYRALKYFRRILKLKAGAAARDKSEMARIKNLARYAIAQVYYAVGYSQDASRSKKLNKKAKSTYARSLREYKYVPRQRGIFQAKMLFETAYVHFMRGDYHFALGKLLALQSPYYRTGFFPELKILRALIYYKNCKYDDTKQTLNRFDKQFKPLNETLKGLNGRRSKRGWIQQYYDFYLREIANLKKKKKTTLPASILTLIGKSKELQNYQALLKKLAQEVAIIKKKGRSWKESNLGRNLVDSARGFRLVLTKFAGLAVLNVLREVNQDVTQQLVQSQLIRVQTLQQQKLELIRYAQGGGIEQDEYRYTIVTEDNHVYWPYQGEYWRDEVGYYRQFIQGECKL